jgi:flagellar biosynthesis/type III secretory pathway protein FliH
MTPTAAETYYNQATTLGFKKGFKKGKAEGKVLGKAKGKAVSIIRALARLIDEPSARLKKRIMQIQSESKLDELFDFAFECVSLGEFETALN